MISAQDIRGVVAVVPTPAKKGANHWTATDTVDLDETIRLVESLIRDGAKAIMALGTMGECATLSQRDYESFVDCLLSTVRGRILTFVGTTALGTHEVVRRIRFVKDRGASGTLLGIPMWQPATLDMAVGFYSDIAEAFPDFPIMVYANARAFRFKFGVDFWKLVAQRAPTVICSKFSNKEILLESLAATRQRVNFVPGIGQAFAFGELSPETMTACWMPPVGPEPAVALLKAINARNWEQAKTVAGDIAWALEPSTVVTKSAEVFASFNIQLEKIQMQASGYCKPGPIRPPYDHMPQNYAEAAQESGRRFATLRVKYMATLK